MGMRQRLGVASCLLGDPELLILDEPMNGLDPAGMHEMRTMIAGLVDEGRTVMLSSHLLDEVERTCDAVAIVDHGRVIRQGSIDELTRGAGTVVVQVDCAEPGRAAAHRRGRDRRGHDPDRRRPDGHPAAGSSRELIADLNRRLVGAGISVYGLQEIQDVPGGLVPVRDEPTGRAHVTDARALAVRRTPIRDRAGRAQAARTRRLAADLGTHRHQAPGAAQAPGPDDHRGGADHGPPVLVLGLRLIFHAADPPATARPAPRASSPG